MKPTVALAGLLCLAAFQAAAADGDYLRDVKPVLSRRCYACHGAIKQKAKLRLDTAARLQRGGESGPAVVAGRSAESRIVAVITGAEGVRMPPEGEPLSAREIASIKAWIDQGAPAPGEEVAQADPRRHWAFVPPERPKVPALNKDGRKRNPIDAFLTVDHERRGLAPRPAADRATLLRRVSLDLIGLVPTPDELRAFQADAAPDAYEQVVERLLADPRHGERWGRHWMDVWRYSDWDGFGAEVRESRPHVWRWRDWIVESLNSDQGYDQMIVAMLAADEAAPDDRDALRATGFLVRNWYKFNRNVWLDRTIEHTSKAFLGITLNCARCHDHKYDPIAQTDYYRVRAFFEPHEVRTDRVPGQADTAKDGLVRVYDATPQAPTFLFERGDEKRPVKDKPLAPGLPAILGGAPLDVRPVSLSPRASYPGLNGFVQVESITAARAEVVSKRAALAQAKKDRLPLAEKALSASRANLLAVEAKIEADHARFAATPALEAGRLVREAGRAERRAALLQAEETLLRAEQALAEARSALKAPGTASPVSLAAPDKAVLLARPGVMKAREALEKDEPTYSPIGPVYPATSTGRRLALARRIASRSNPLTARVAVNHIWMHHFGAPLVPTVFDFGLNGKAPSHPALLDWLAVEFMDGGWSMKALHRLVVTSAAYGRESTSGGSDDSNVRLDPENVFLWRMNPRRMEAEAVRDNVLYVAGNLDLTMGGADIDPNLGLTARRRSLYFRHAKEKRVTFLKLFDSADVSACYRRSDSVMPQQALALANSPLSFEQARLLAERLRQAIGTSNTAFVEAAFDRVLGRTPVSEEREACEQYLRDQARRLSDKSRLTPFGPGPPGAVKPAVDPCQRAREDLVHVLFNHNDFLTIR